MITESKLSKTNSGYVDVAFRRGQYVLDNVLDGLLETNKFLQNFQTKKTKDKSSKQVAFGEDSQVVVGGSDHGVVYVFDRKTGEILDQLHHAPDGLAPAISVSVDRPGHG